MERKAVHNLLRHHHLHDPTMEIEEWKVDDYRAMSIDDLFGALSQVDVVLDRGIFLSMAEAVDSPEDLSDMLADELELGEEEADLLFLLIFELWRRLIPEKQTVSIFCDELDTQIFLYDSELLEHPDTLEDLISSLLQLLNEQVDEGDSPQDLFETIKENLANDLEGFLYDFISERIDLENYDYAMELVDGFNEFVEDPKWFALLKVRILMANDPEESTHLLDQLLLLTNEEKDLDFQLEFLSLLVQEGDPATFREVVSRSLRLVQNQDELEDLLALCEEYFHCLDLEQKAEQVVALSHCPFEEARTRLLPLFPS